MGRFSCCDTHSLSTGDQRGLSRAHVTQREEMFGIHLTLAHLSKTLDATGTIREYTPLRRRVSFWSVGSVPVRMEMT